MLLDELDIGIGDGFGDDRPMHQSDLERYCSKHPQDPDCEYLNKPIVFKPMDPESKTYTEDLERWCKENAAWDTDCE